MTVSKLNSAVRLALLRVLKCPVCPMCGSAKKEKQCFCQTCYFALPEPLRGLLYTEFDTSGEFEDHYLRAMRDLKSRGMARPLKAWMQKARKIIEGTGLIAALIDLKQSKKGGELNGR